MQLGLIVDRVDLYAVALPPVRSSGVAGDSVAVAGHPIIRIPTWRHKTTESIYSTITRDLTVQGTGA